MPVAVSTKRKSKIKSERLNVRVTASQARLIRLAAQQSQASASSFLVESACLRAEETLASQQHFAYTPAQWSAFTAALDRAPMLKPRLRRLLATPSILERA